MAANNRAARVDRETARKMSGVAQVRQDKQLLRKDLVEQNRVQLAANKARRAEIKEADEKLKRDKEKLARKKAVATKKAYDLRVAAEQQQIDEREREVRRMEATEMKLIKQLKERQVLQRDAFVMLEGALNNT